MSIDHSGVYASGVEEIVEDLRIEFFDEVAENLRSLALALEDARHDRKAPEDVMDMARRLALKLRGQSANFGARLLGTLAHRMEDYMANMRAVPPRFFDDLQVFIDAMTDVVEGRTSLDADPSKIVRTLPAKGSFDIGDIEIRDVEVMLVMLHGTQTRYVEREMQECGYRVVNVTSTFEALPMIVRTKPDLVIISAVMPELDGIDLSIALASMPSTRNIPIALITSLDPEDDHLRMLPGVVPVIHKGPSFGDDLAEALSRLFII